MSLARFCSLQGPLSFQRWIVVVLLALDLSGRLFVRGQSATNPKQNISNRTLDIYNLGFIEMELKSSSSSETNLLLKSLLDVTVNYLHEAFTERAERMNERLHNDGDDDIDDATSKNSSSTKKSRSSSSNTSSITIKAVPTSTFSRVSCSIQSYQLGSRKGSSGSSNDKVVETANNEDEDADAADEENADATTKSSSSSLFAANITITGQAYFWTTTSHRHELDGWNITEWAALAFETATKQVVKNSKANGGDDATTTTRTSQSEKDSSDGDVGITFVQALANSPDPFLSNVTYAAVMVNGAIVAAEDVSGENDNDASSDASGNFNSRPFAVLEVWMIPLIGGGGAFLLVLCCIVTCICCMRIDDPHNDMKHRENGGAGPHDAEAAGRPGVAGVVTIPTTTVNADDDEDEEEDRASASAMMPSLPPSPVKSIGSQDSSTFTYNPKSVRSLDNRSYVVAAANSFSYSRTGHGNNGMEMDLQTWQNGGGPIPASYSHHSSGSSTGTGAAGGAADTTGAMGAGPPFAHPQPSFGHDISAIESVADASKRDLSLIQEGEDESNCESPLDLSVASKSRASGSGKYKSLLSRCTGVGGVGNNLNLALDNEVVINNNNNDGGDARKKGCVPLGFKPSFRPTTDDDDDDRDDDEDDDDNSSFLDRAKWTMAVA